MPYSWGFPMGSVWTACGHIGGLSIVGGHLSRSGIHNNYASHMNPSVTHTTTHRLLTGVFRGVFHVFHKTYNYNNLYKENCV